MSEVTFENNLYRGYLEKYSDLLEPYLRDIVLLSAGTKPELFCKVIKCALLNDGNRTPPIMLKEYLKLFPKAKRNEINNLFRGGNKTIDAEKAEEIFAISIGELSAEEQVKLCKKLIADYTDFAGICKLISFANDFYPAEYKNNLIHNSVSKRIEIISRKAAKSNDCRNKYLAHKKAANISTLNVDECARIITGMAESGLEFNIPDNKRMSRSRAKIEQQYNSYLEILSYVPLTKDDLEREIEGFNIEAFKTYIGFREYDTENGVLYSHTIDEVKDFFMQFRIADEATEKLKEELSSERAQNAEFKGAVESISNILVDAALPRIIQQIKNEFAGSNISGVSAEMTSTATPVIDEKSEIIEVVKNTATIDTTATDPRILRREAVARLLPNTMRYKGGRLTDDHIRELVGNTVVMADADFWLNEDNANFLLRDLNKYLKACNQKLFIDWNSRVELFRYERNIEGSATKEQIKGAKDAHTKMHFMMSIGYAAYLPANNDVCSSDYAIIKLAKEHPEVIFTVFSNSAELSDRLKHEQIDNIIPVSYIANTKMCIIKSELLSLLKEAINGDIPEEDKESDEATDSKEIEKVLEKPVAADTLNKESLPEDKGEKKATEGKKQASKEREYKTVTIKEYKLVEESNQLLSLSTEPKTGDTLFDEDGTKIILGDVLGTGGEGAIFKCSEPGKVVKIYHRNKLTATRLSKLNLMLEYTPKSKKICWPEKLVYNENKEFVGYVMKSAEGYKEFGVTVLKLNSKTVAENSMKGWDRLALVELCLDLCKTFQRMHERSILMGDVNFRNMMLNNSDPNNHVDYKLVDCDSYQIQGYPCPVGTMVFTSPKIYQRNNTDPTSLNFGKFLRTIEDENYAIASLLFHILMLNQSPFAKKNGSDNIEEAIRNYDFAYRLRGDSENTGADVPDGAFRMIWNNMPYEIKELFGDAFKRQKNVELKTWIYAFEDYKRKIINGRYSRELMPKLYYDPTGDFAIDFTCDACGEKRNMPRDRYERVAERNMPHLCNDCLTIMNSMKEIPIQRYCKRCGRPFQVNAWDEWLEKKWNRSTRKNCRSCIEYYKSRNR